MAAKKVKTKSESGKGTRKHGSKKKRGMRAEGAGDSIVNAARRLWLSA
jgi:hypothetical protein